MQSYPFDWNWDSFTVTNTAATTLIVILFSTSFTRSFLLRILRAPRDFLNRLGVLGKHDEKVDIHDSEREYNEDEMVMDDRDVWQQDEDNMFLRLRDMVQEQLPYLPYILSSAYGYFEKISGRLMFDMEDTDLFQSHNKGGSNNATGRLRKVAGVSEQGRGQLPNIALPPQPMISEGETINQTVENMRNQQINKSKMISFDPNIEPAFLNNEDYPDDW
eukprot:CAMPEP_0176497774 /NCGR_PEP_ID=MMETSP0200_2-20121128/11922_1 /TAXON_ID=947934 /ORGANISM="Chaetoceros sp., Strain GSL56" /LENGTH=217 /DNA_ID=CAMNT_0017895847 /DNA_START=33 /DNA_END=683 /DNA_ORIENTATION=+